MKNLMLITLMLFSISFSNANEKIEQPLCQNNPDIVGECFVVHGRITAGNGTPSVRLWIIGTNRLLGVSAEGEGLPNCIIDNLTPDTSIVYGDFLVCPFAEDKPGVMRPACIESASNIVVEKIEYNPKSSVAIFPEQRSCDLAP